MIVKINEEFTLGDEFGRQSQCAFVMDENNPHNAPVVTAYADEDDVADANFAVGGKSDEARRKKEEGLKVVNFCHLALKRADKLYFRPQPVIQLEQARHFCDQFRKRAKVSLCDLLLFVFQPGLSLPNFAVPSMDPWADNGFAFMARGQAMGQVRTDGARVQADWCGVARAAPEGPCPAERPSSARPQQAAELFGR